MDGTALHSDRFVKHYFIWRAYTPGIYSLYDDAPSETRYPVESTEANANKAFCLQILQIDTFGI